MDRLTIISGCNFLVFKGVGSQLLFTPYYPILFYICIPIHAY